MQLYPRIIDNSVLVSCAATFIQLSKSLPFYTEAKLELKNLSSLFHRPLPALEMAFSCSLVLFGMPPYFTLSGESCSRKWNCNEGKKNTMEKRTFLRPSSIWTFRCPICSFPSLPSAYGLKVQKVRERRLCLSTQDDRGFDFPTLSLARGGPRK